MRDRKNVTNADGGHISFIAAMFINPDEVCGINWLGDKENVVVHFTGQSSLELVFLEEGLPCSRFGEGL